MALLVTALPLTGESERAISVPLPRFVAHEPVEFTFTSAGVDVSMEHGLGRIPDGYIVIGRSADIRVYNGSAPSSETILVLRASGAGEATVLPL